MNAFHGRHFQGEIILWAVRWYCKYGISYRELQEMLAERGVSVDHTTFIAGFSVMLLKWKNVYVGIGIILHRSYELEVHGRSYREKMYSINE